MAPAARSRSAGWVPLAAIGAVVFGAFILVTSLYDAEGGLTQSGGATTLAATGFTAAVTPIAVQPLTSTATVRLSFRSVGDDMLDDSGRLGQNTRVTVITDTGVTESRYPAGTVPVPVEVEMGVDGDQTLYPFDEHSGQVIVVMDSYEVRSDGAVGSLGPLPLTLGADAGVSGWNTTATFTEGSTDEPVATFVFSRAFSTQAFAILILVVSVVLAGMALVVGVLTKTRRRIVEATLLSWSAALLFALPALRNFMPNAPPIGAAIDVYVFMWVMLAAVGAAALVILAWIERDRPRKDADHAA